MRFRFILLVLLSCFFLFYTNCSFAYTWNDFIEFCDQNKTGQPDNRLNSAVSYLVNNQTYVENSISSLGVNLNNYDCFLLQWPDSDIYAFYLYVFNYNGTGSYTVNSSNYIVFNNYGTGLKLEIYKTNYSRLNSKSNFNFNSNFRMPTGLLVTAPSDNNYRSLKLQNSYIPPYTGPEFTPVNNGTITVFNELGISETFVRLPFFPNGQNDWTLGYISNYDEVYAINGYFGPYTQSDSNGNVIDESLNNFNYNYYLGTYNGGLCFDSSTGRVYIKKDRLLNKQGYGLRLNYQASIDSNNADDFYEGNYYSYYGYFSLSSGDLISSDLPNYTDINGFINSFGDFWKSDESDLENYDRDLNEALQPKGLFGSGDLFSGELLGNLGYDDSPLRTDYSLFVVRVYRQFISAMRSEYTNSSISFTIHGHTYTYYASDFAVPDSDLKTFVRNYLIAGIFILIIYQIHFIFITIITFDIFGLARSFDQKHTIFM